MLRSLYQRWEREKSVYAFRAPSKCVLEGSLGSYFLLAEGKRGIVGFVRALVRRDNLSVFPKRARYLEIDDLYVVPWHRSQGVGSVLLRRVLVSARQGGLRYVHVYTGSKSVERILRFYRGHEFIPWGIQLYRRM